LTNSQDDKEVEMKAVLTAMSAAVLLLACGSQPATVPTASAVPPRAESLVQPAYPEEARKAGIEGTSIVEVTVGADGVMTRCSIAVSSGNAALDEAALQAVHVSRFAAGTKDGKPVEMMIQVPFRFKLADKQSSRLDVQDVRGVVGQHEPLMPAMEV
jgi:TonB family protein